MELPEKVLAIGEQLKRTQINKYPAYHLGLLSRATVTAEQRCTLVADTIGGPQIF